MRWDSEACRCRCDGFRRGRNQQIPEGWYQHLLALLRLASRFAIDERGNVTLRHWHTPSGYFPVSLWASRTTTYPNQCDVLALSKDDFGTAANNE